MRFDELLNQNGISSEISIFSHTAEEIMKFNLPALKDTEPFIVNEKQCLSFQLIAIDALQKNILAESVEYQCCCYELEQVLRKLQNLSGDDETLRNCRAKRKSLISQKNSIEEEAAKQARTQLFGVSSFRKTLCMKGVIYSTSMSSLCSFLPQLNAVSIESNLRKIPIFTDGIPQWNQRFEAGHRFAVEGGPCLFGADEALVIVQLYDGTEYTFDFVTENDLSGKMPDLSQFAEDNEGMAKTISFNFSKTALTEAEYNSLLYVFEIAAAFNVDAYIPLPDFSYEKYMKSILENLIKDESNRESIVQEFHEEINKITGIYLNEIENVKKLYSDVWVKIIHGENHRLRKIYCEKRKQFINRDNHMLKTLTTNSSKYESILDYITMPALPYYLDGVTDIIQVDCIDETDSYRKCQKLHKGIINIYPFLYPEPISSDGENTDYYAKREYKKYLKELK